ncbi:MAG: hypothetical protein IJ764_04930, partial [Bacteroidales bacterium]|nr:hypothetical protein [Bacteroidales bacterium]
YNVSLEYGNYNLRISTNNRGETTYNPTMRNECKVMTDRPVYKPGEDVQFACLVYRSDHWKKSEYLAHTILMATLRDVHHKIVDTLQILTNRNGMAYGRLSIPPQTLPGYFTLTIEAADKADGCRTSQGITVEAYRQPTFAITLHSEDGAYRYGRLAHFSGNAISYNGIPISNAKITYRIERKRNTWLWYWRGDVAQTVASGDTTSNEDGHFDIYFTPEADSTVELTDKTSFSYTLYATVTDLNGETHEQSASINIGIKNAFLQINNAEEVNEMKMLRFQYLNLDGKPLDGSIRITIDRLRPPHPLLSHRNSNNSVMHSLSQQEFTQRFPNMAYDLAESDINYWNTEKRIYTSICMALSGQQENSVALPVLTDGVYRIQLTTEDKLGDTIIESKVITLTSDKAHKCQNNNLLWSDINHSKAKVGDKIRLRVGSRHKGLNVLCAIADGNGHVERSIIAINNEIKKLEIPITETMLGGCTVTLIAIKEGVVAQQNHTIDVPFSHKQLSMRFESFRDHLLPGSQEEWTIRISDEDNHPIQGVITATLYDASLDNYGSLQWSLWPWRGNQSQIHLWPVLRKLYYSWDMQQNVKSYHSTLSPIQWRVDMDNLIYGGIRRRYVSMSPVNIMYKTTAVADALLENSIDQAEDDAATGESEILTQDVTSESSSSKEIQTRENQSTLAFFTPCLESSDSGIATLRFTMPEALTQWNLMALSHTSTMQVGLLKAQVVTQKQLMLTPMMPRFFRQNDSVIIAAKISNITEEEQDVTVTLILRDAESNRQWDVPKAIRMSVPAKTNSVATFGLEVPAHSHAAIYRMTVEGKDHSDGEQGIVAVLSNKQLVTESKAMFVNGIENKHYTLPSMKPSESREPRLLAIEFTSNPLWLSIQSLPYVSEQKNPSNIYLFNQYFCNKISMRITQDNPAIAKIFQQWQADTTHPLQSRLTMNDDLKQTMADETPWMQEAQSETEKMQQIARFFDTKGLSTELQNTANKIQSSQHPDGGWSWMPDGNYSSVYTTRYMLRLFGHLNPDERKPFEQSIHKALAYIDQEAAKDYEHYRKDKVKDAFDADFLYLHSCHPSVAVSPVAQEAYQYYLSNAKRHCLKQSGIYHRALLAIIMQRTGERAKASALIEQLRQCALTSTEMGMYWRDNISGLFWNERPIEVQSFIIEAFKEVAPNDKESIALMRQWLLKQKQTTAWNSDIASVAAISALLEGDKTSSQGHPANIIVGRDTLNNPTQAGTGYIAQRWAADKITHEMSEISITQHDENIGWGAAYWQYLDELDKIESSSMGIGLQKTYLRIGSDGKPTPLNDNDTVSVGDHIRVQILVSCDRHIEYIELKEARPAGFEPQNSASGWRWSDGLSYYAAVTNTALHCYIDRMDKGKYVISYDLYAIQAGRFNTGLTLMQSLYAPEFRAIGASRTLTVQP